MDNRVEFSFLKQIQRYVIKYANVISEVLNIDIEIVDENLLRVAGTGVYSSLINRRCEGLSYKNVLETGEHKIILDPINDSCCEGCKLKGTCKEVLEIATPIFFNDRIIGVIGLICLDKERKKGILQNVDENLRFLDNISELISSKVYEEFKDKKDGNFLFALNQFANNVDSGIIILSDENIIYDLNEKAIKEFNSKKGKSLIIDKKEIIGTYFDVNKYKNIGNEISINIGEYKKIFIFDNKKHETIKVNDEVLTGVERIIGKSKSITNIKEKVKKVADSTSTILITGESGTGKEVLAKAIHESSDRRDKPFIAINCAAIPENLLESELLGYEKGAFSGASTQGRIGKFELANKGVIFLDEIGDMPLNLQAKILRVIQERKCVRVGSNKLIDLDIRIIAATNKKLKTMVEEGTFREDLYYRLNVIPMRLPPLRERDGDVKILMENFMDKYSEKLNREKKEITKEALEKIVNYNWPGNIRELENCVEYMINISQNENVITDEFLPEFITNYKKEPDILSLISEDLTLNELEKKYIDIMMGKYGSDLKAKNIIANKLGIGIATLYRKIDKEKIAKEN